jgi:ribonuclease P/MRP protein subunit RPP1
MYEAVHAVPDGDATVARLASTAAEYGFEGVVVRNHGDARGEYDAAAVAEAYGVDVVPGVEIRADGPEQASGYLGNYRPDHVVLAVHGGDADLNRFAVQQDRVDVLAHPLADDGDAFDHVDARAAREHGVRVAVNLAPVLREDGGPRVQAIERLRRLRRLLEQYDAPFVVSADPFSHLQLRAPRELVAVGEVVGFDAAQIENGLREWGRLAERNRARLDERFVEPGVWAGPLDEPPPGSERES